MEQRVNKRRRLVIPRQQQLQDVPELIHHVQSLLPADEAARTSVLSKSWLYAFSTSPDLRFQPVKSFFNKQHQQERRRRYARFITRTLRRYHRHNLPIITCHLHFSIHKHKSASRAEKWINKLLLTSKTCLKELCLTILPAVASYTLPDVLFSSEKLDKLSLQLASQSNPYSLHVSSNPVISCVNLRVLELLDVRITQDALHNLLSTCKLLENINLKLPNRLKKIKVNNLPYLHHLKIAPMYKNDNLEISDVPSLHSFFYDRTRVPWMPVFSNIDTIGSLRELCLDCVSMDDDYSDIINSKFPFLESLTLILDACRMETLDIRCVSLRRLTIHMKQEQLKVQVCAPKLLFFRYECYTIPDFLFPVIAPEQFELHMMLVDAIDDMLFLKMRAALNLSSKFKIEFDCYGFTVPPFDTDDVRRRITFPATNVEKLLLVEYSPDNSLDKSLFIDVLFSICRPNQVEVSYDFAHNVANYFSVVEKKTGNVYWPHVEIRDPDDAQWGTLSTSTISLLDELFHCEFKPNWSHFP